MDEHDRSNLNFLLSIDEATFKDWYSKMDGDDITYAHELLAMASEELEEKSRMLRVEAELALMNTYPDALKVLSKHLH